MKRVYASECSLLGALFGCSPGKGGVEVTVLIWALSFTLGCLSNLFSLSALNVSSCSHLLEALEAWGNRNLAQVQNVSQLISFHQAWSSRAEDLVVPPLLWCVCYILPIFVLVTSLELMLKPLL